MNLLSASNVPRKTFPLEHFNACSKCFSFASFAATGLSKNTYTHNLLLMSSIQLQLALSPSAGYQNKGFLAMKFLLLCVLEYWQVHHVRVAVPK